MPQQPLLINGVNYAWANITLALFGVPLYGITKINYKKSQVKDNNYGLGKEPISRGYGMVEYEGDIEIYVDELKRLSAAAPDGDILKIPWFDIPIIYSGDGVLVRTTTLKAVEFKEDPLSASQGDTKLVVSVPLIIGGIVHK